VVIGHEFSGYVQEIHPDALTSVKVNDLVSIDPNMPCNQCAFCRNKKYHLCNNLFCIGVTVDGGMSQYVSVPARAVIAVPSNVTPEVAALAEPLSCVVHAVDKGHIKTGDTALVIGAGPIGLMTTALASMNGARVTVIEPTEYRRKTAIESFGASEAYAPGELKPVDGVLGEGYDVVFECVGRSQTAEMAVSFAKAGGNVVWIGVAKVEDRASISPFEIYRKELTITSTYTNPYGIDRAVKILSEDRIDWTKLISHSFKLQDFEKAWEVFLGGTGLKVVVTP
jgi:threonine dehydrogenase-like Zn-dependent dehydrogenase